MKDVRIRPARPGDEQVIVDLVRELAEYERAADQAIATPDLFRAALFSENPAVFAHIAECASDESESDETGAYEVVGFALWFRNFSTWLGKHGIYLEDLYVRPEFRGHGIGQALMAEIAKICVEQGYPRFEWWVLDWNELAREVYHHIGAEALTEWIPYRLSGSALNELALNNLAARPQ